MTDMSAGVAAVSASADEPMEMWESLMRERARQYVMILIACAAGSGVLLAFGTNPVLNGATGFVTRVLESLNITQISTLVMAALVYAVIALVTCVLASTIYMIAHSNLRARKLPQGPARDRIFDRATRIASEYPGKLKVRIENDALSFSSDAGGFWITAAIMVAVALTGRILF